MHTCTVESCKLGFWFDFVIPSKQDIVKHNLSSSTKFLKHVIGIVYTYLSGPGISECCISFIKSSRLTPDNVGGM